MKFNEKNNIGILRSRSSSWTLDFIVEALSNYTNITQLKEEGSSNTLPSDHIWERSKGIINHQIINSFDGIIIPCCFPYLDNPVLIKDLLKVKASGLSIITLVLDPAGADTMKSILELSSNIILFDNKDLVGLTKFNLRPEQIKILPFPKLTKENSLIKKNDIACLNFTSDKEYDEVILSSLYEIAERKISFVSLPESNSIKTTEESLSLRDDFFNSIQRLGLDNKILHKSLSTDYESLKSIISQSEAIIIPGRYNNEILQKRIILELCNFYSTLPIQFDSTASLSSSQSSILSVQGITVREKSKYLIQLINSLSLISKVIDSTYDNIDKNNWDKYFLTIEKSEEIILVDQVIEDLPIVLTTQLPKILFRSRDNSFTQPGGDTVAMNCWANGLRDLGYDITVDTEGKENIKDFDLVQLFNFALKDHTESLARECVENKVPYVVVTLYEDWPKFYNQMITAYQAVSHYISQGQNRNNWPILEENIRKALPTNFWDNSYTARHSQALIVTGENEEKSILRDYPFTNKVYKLLLGSEVSNNLDSGDLFRNKFGIDNFVLCVGRLETRKNQLMLLKAMEDSDLTLVFAASGFTYQAEYESACRAFKRKGKTIFLERLTPEELSSAYQAAKVHALPSWYELPGLVSIEAARLGCNVVASKYGTIEDYLGQYAFYCKPDDVESINAAVIAAYYAPKRDQLSELANELTWEKSCIALSNIYQEVLDTYNNNLVSNKEKITLSTDPVPLVDNTSIIISQINEADTLTISGKLEEAKELYNKIFSYDNLRDDQKVKLNRSLGVLNIQLGKFAEAKEFFHRALLLNPKDIKSILGSGHVIWETSNKEEAYSLYKQAASLDPSDKSAILYLVSSSYELNKLSDLEQALREYLRDDQSNIQIQYCLAGCYYKQKKYGAAIGLVERILKIDPNRSDALELKELISNSEEKSKEVLEVENVDKKTLVTSNLKSDLEELKNKKQYDELIELADTVLLSSKYSQEEKNFSKLLQAESYGCLGNLVQAEKLFEELVEVNFMTSRVLCGLGAISAFISDWDRAEQYFERSLSFDPTSDMPLAGLGICAESVERFEDAWNYFSEALNRNPENIQALTGIIKLGYKINRLDQVEDNLKKYLDMKPVDLSILYSLAGCLYAQGRTVEAVSELKNILIFDPEHTHANELLEEIENGKKYSNL